MTKSTGSRKIDLGIALAMACVAAIQAGYSGNLEIYAYESDTKRRDSFEDFAYARGNGDISFVGGGLVDDTWESVPLSQVRF